MEAIDTRSRRYAALGRKGGAAKAAKAVTPAREGYTDRPLRHALVADADPATVRLCRDVLESAGFVVDAVESGVAALVTALDRLPYVILIASQLRDVPGREAIGWLRANPTLRSTPIIVLATDIEDEVDPTMARPGALLRRPLSAELIRRAVGELLA